jgi:1,2-diacylglycerol 3-alpha-glucosyltransferase
MRIAIFQDTWHPKIDGVVVSTELFVGELRRRGHDVKLIVPNHPSLKDQPQDDDVILLDSVPFDFIYPGATLGKFWNTGLSKVFAKWRPDVIHSMTEFTIGHWLASYWRSKLGIPRVHTFHTLWTEYLFYAPLPEFFTQRLLRFVANSAVKKRFDAVIAPSEAMRSMLAVDWRVQSHIDVLPTGIKIDRMQGGSAERFRARWSVKPDEKILLYLGRMGVEKNVELVVEAMAKLKARMSGERNAPKVRLVLAGDGPRPYMEKLRKLASDRGLHDIVWTGFVKGDDWLDCYAAADTVLFPSLTETQGLVVVEALAAGVPVVAVEAMGPACILAGEKGGLFSTNDAAHFADQVHRMVSDDVLHARKKREAREVAKQYSLDTRTTELEAIYARVTGIAAPAQRARPALEERRPMAARAMAASRQALGAFGGSGATRASHTSESA